MINNELNNSTLVPVDFSATSLLALDHAVAMTEIVNDSAQLVTLLHIIEGGNFDIITDKVQINSSDRDALAIEGAITRLESIILKYGQSKNVEFKYIVAGGKPYKTIAEVASRIYAGTIVMGTHGSSGLQVFAGSNASRVIQLSPCPVVVIKEKPFGKGYKNIVLPIDITAETKQKVNMAVKIAQKYNSTVHIVGGHESDEFLSHRVVFNMKQVADYLTERGVANSSHELNLKSGSFAMLTMTFAQGMNADLIIVMSQQDKSLSEYIYGSYAQQIVNRSKIPVMAVNTSSDLESTVENIVGTGAIYE